MNFSIEEIPFNVAVYKPTEDEDFIFVEVNKKLENTENISKEMLIGKRVTEVFPGVDEMGLLECFRKVNKTGKEEILEFAFYEDDEKRGWRRNRIVKLANGNIAAFYGKLSNSDVVVQEFEKELNKKTKELQKQKDAFELLFEKSSDGILIIEDEYFVQCNEKIVEMLGAKNKEEVLHTHPSELSPEFQPDGEDSYSKARKMMQIAQQKGTHSFEWVHLKQNGEEFFVEVTLTSISLYNRDILHVVWRDISKRKEIEQLQEKYNKKLITLNKELDKRVAEEIQKNKEQEKQMLLQSRLAQMGEMLSMIAHQWRQPLGAIASVSANLKLKLMLESFSLESKEGQEECSQYFIQRLENIELYIDNLTKTIDDFRNFYKPDKKAVVITLEDIVEKSLQIILSSLKNHNIEVIKEYQTAESLNLHDSEVIQVVLNILKNAQDNFVEKEVENPKIFITLKGSTLSICDNGGGISEEILGKIFDPYFSTKHQKNGTGLGLYMSKTIIEEHHKGFLNVYNSEDGVCFSIEIGSRCKI